MKHLCAIERHCSKMDSWERMRVVNTTSTPPRVTVLMAVHNGARYLRESIDSILAQTFSDFELLVVDDASGDESPAILAACRDPRLRLLRNSVNLGLTGSLNIGLRVARGELVARQDDDDLSRRDRLARQVEYLDTHREVAVAGTRRTLIDTRGRRIGNTPYHASSPLAMRWQFLFFNPLTHSSVMFRRREIADELGGYDETMRLGQDFELWSRVLARFEIANLPQPLLRNRIHSGSVTRHVHDTLDEQSEATARNLAVQKQIVSAVLGDAVMADEWPRLWSGIAYPRYFAAPGEPLRAMELLEALWRLFLARHPGAANDPDVHRVTADVRARIASHLVRHGAAADGFRAYIGAWKESGIIAAQFAPRMLAESLIGPAVIEAARRFRRRRREL
jgi:hypothetical protein